MKSLLAGITVLIMVCTGAYSQELTAETPIEKFAAFAESEQLDVTAWSITLKETIPRSDSLLLEKKISKSHRTAEVSYEDQDNSNKIILKDGLNNREFDESYSIILPKNKDEKAELVYYIAGKGTISLTPEVKDRIREIEKRYFSKNVLIFSCLKAESSGIIDDVLVYKKFKQTFDIKPLDQVAEKDWTSSSGYTEEWGQAIPTAGGKMNVQFATRTLGGRTNITIGTPIITAEY
ncbi:YwmB family TATA-box binding protein [Halobacillus halophilus]|uniref:YwmB family TATA-box binding protein n=1 Tax=Halobacillus halophilus TaxID=1570 RepID=UPI001CD3479C|nr:YwmB family TATA-box binding protein [Halobacillus halophilus]MCA1010884.1 YwmB family TATA-box binding protein [Halobacillus halophilus]